MSVLDDVKEAICDKKLIEFDYDGFHRIYEPHIVGKKNGSDAVLCYQIQGESSQGLIPSVISPEWRLMYLVKIEFIKILDENFNGLRQTKTGMHMKFDETYKIVDD